LYLAQTYETALAEKFGVHTAGGCDLTPLQLALRRPTSFTQVRVQGRLEGVLNVGDAKALKAFVEVIKEFAVPKGVATLARQLGLKRPPEMVRSVGGLQKQLIDSNWRMLPVQYDLPSNSQVFGRIAVAAGLSGILFPSSRVEGAQCLACFPQNWRGSGCFVELMDPAPRETVATRIDGQSILPP
jgi:hypothetical protein